MTELRRAGVRVPCSTSNLGSGYDTVGLAFERYLDATFEPDDSQRLRLERSGTLERVPGGVEDDLLAVTFTRVLERAGVVPSGTLRLTSSIPVARGLGSSASAILGGADLARAALSLEPDPDHAFDLALRHEGHGDNAAPSLFGGLRAVAQTADGPVVMGLNLHPDVGFAYAAPAAGVSTQEARELLPKTVPHKTAAASLGRLAALMRGLAEANPDLIRVGVMDELHVPHRLPMIPGAMAAIGAAVDAGAWAVTISGAGSGLIALSEPLRASAVADAMREVFDAGVNDPECVGFALRPCIRGLHRIDG